MLLRMLMLVMLMADVCCAQTRIVSRQRIVEHYYILLSSTDMRGTTTIEIEDGRASVYHGDVGLPAVLCGADAAFICVHNVGFTFAVPKVNGQAVLKKGDRWTYDGRSYRVSDVTPTISIAGVEAYVVLGETPLRGSRFKYFFSQKYGLLGFVVREPEPENIDLAFVSEKRCGFGASPSCQE